MAEVEHCDGQQGTMTTDRQQHSSKRSVVICNFGPQAEVVLLESLWLVVLRLVALLLVWMMA
jgi:hypothetical protein